MMGQIQIARRNHFPVESAERITLPALLRTALLTLEMDFGELRSTASFNVLWVSRRMSPTVLPKFKPRVKTCARV